jgi:hypothetical protein
MKVLFIAKRARHQFSLEQSLAIFKSINEWHAKQLKDGTYDCIYTFVEGGGIGIANVDSLEAAYDLLDDYPANLFFDWEVHALVETRHAVEKSISNMEKALGQ